MSGLADKNILVTGGTGSFGNEFVKTVLATLRPKRLIVFSRDEWKQSEMRKAFPDGAGSPMRYFVGDVRDQSRLRRALAGVDYVVHAAALKQIPSCEYNPIEAVRTNIGGAANLIEAALDMGVERLIALSSDKATSPVNLYGATKLVAEKLFVQSNSYSGAGGCRFSCVRYGNVLGSRGSIVPLLREQAKNGKVDITDERMTRFWITLPQAVAFVISCLTRMRGGEIFLPKLPSMRVVNVAQALCPGCEVNHIGMRPGEKMAEAMVSVDEAHNTIDVGDRYVILPAHPWWNVDNYPHGEKMPEGWSYTSDQNTNWIKAGELLEMCGAG